jgi:transposase, IS30 family
VTRENTGRLPACLPLDPSNGLIRYYLPKGTDLSGWTQDQLDAIADKLSTRPCRTLDYRTLAEALDDLLAA